MIIILIMWFILIGYGISFHKQNNPFEQEQTLALRGICSVEIMMGHIGLTTGSVILYPNRKAGILFVGIFFLLSGYGVAYCTEQKTDYLKNLLVKRTVKILLPAYFSVNIYDPIAICFAAYKRTISYSLRRFFYWT